MKKIFYLLVIATISFSFFSCEDDNQVDEEWKNTNWDAYIQATEDPNFSLVKGLEGSATGVYKRVIQSGTGDVHPFQTAQVKVNYKGYYYDGTVFDAGSSETEVPVSFKVNGVVRGFSAALQNMVVGDKWEIVIPYHLAYGVNGWSSIKGYTTLFFELELLEIDQYPQ